MLFASVCGVQIIVPRKIHVDHCVTDLALIHPLKVVPVRPFKKCLLLHDKFDLSLVLFFARNGILLHFWLLPLKVAQLMLGSYLKVGLLVGAAINRRRTPHSLSHFTSVLLFHVFNMFIVGQVL